MDKPNVFVIIGLNISPRDFACETWGYFHKYENAIEALARYKVSQQTENTTFRICEVSSRD